MNKPKFIELPHVCGNSNATETTVQLFNSVRARKRDRKGFYFLKAIKPERNGVLVVKEYLAPTNKGGRPPGIKTKVLSFRVAATIADEIRPEIQAIINSKNAR